MPIVGAAGSGNMAGTLGGAGFTGPDLMNLTDACGNGTESHLVGKFFATIDTGLIPGIGMGTGTGLMGIVGAMISATAFAMAAGSFGQSGPNLMDLTDAFGDMVVFMASQATLMSNHTPVFQGAGIVTPGSIPVVGSGWGSDIEGQAGSFSGGNWPDLASALGAGGAAGFATATGNVTISGTFTGPTPPGPLPGAGSGMGTIS